MSTLQSPALSDVYRMEIDCRGQVAVIKLSGLVTMDQCDAIRDRLVWLVAERQAARLVFDPSVDGVLVKPLMLPRLEARQRSRPNQFVERRLGDLQVRRELDNGEDLVLVFRHRENPCQ